MIAIDLIKQKALDVDRKTMQEINFIGNLERNRNKNNEEQIETVLDFSQGTVTVFVYDHY